MAFLFTVSEKTVTPTVEALMVSPFKEIWERDGTKQKTRAISEFTFIEFMTSQKKTNPYRGYTDGQREKKIVSMLFPGEEWTPDDLVKEGIQMMDDFQYNASPTYGYYMAARKGAEKLKKFFLTFDMNEVNARNGNPIYKPRDITSALKDTEDVLMKLNKLEKKVEEELYDKTVTKANKEISEFANPESMD